MSWSIINLSLCLFCVFVCKKKNGRGGDASQFIGSVQAGLLFFLGTNIFVEAKSHKQKGKFKSSLLYILFLHWKVSFQEIPPFGRFPLAFPFAICPQMSYYIPPQITNYECYACVCWGWGRAM